MEKSKIWVWVILILALLFFCSMDAEASNPVYDYDVLYQGTIPSTTKNYFFDIGADGVFVDFDTNNVDDNVSNPIVSYSSGIATFHFDTGPLSKGFANISDMLNYDGASFSFAPNVTASLTINDSGLEAYGTSYFTVMPYVLWNGSKYYMNSTGWAEFTSSPNFYHLHYSIGAEIQASVYFNGVYQDLENIKTYFGNVVCNVKVIETPFYVYGYKYVSSGDYSIIDTITSWKDSLSQQMSDWRSSLDFKLDKVVEALSFDYDASGAQSTNSELSGTLDSWEAAEGPTMENAQIDVGEYDTASAFQFVPALISSLTLITTFSNSFFVASGDFSTALIVMIALVFVSVVVGLIRFVK